MRTLAYFFVCIMFCVSCNVLLAQEKVGLLDKLSTSLNGIDTKLINKLDKQYQKTAAQLTKQTTSYLSKLQKQEEKLKRKLAKTDSLKAEQVFGNVQERYKKLQASLTKQGGRVKEYIPGLDSLGTAAQYLKQKADSASGTTSTLNPSTPQLPTIPILGIGTNPLTTQTPNLKGISNPYTPQLGQFNATVKGLQQKLQNTGEIKKQLQQRKEQLKQQLQNTPLAGQLKSLNKQVFYYNQQLNEYKELFANTDKLTEKLMKSLRESPAFKSFFSRNSQLAGLFGIPTSTGGSIASLAGLQTRASVMEQMQQKMGGVGGGMQYIQQQIGAAKSEMDKLKNKLQLPDGSTVADADMPNFKPNKQKTKTFWKRLEYGGNIQSQKSNSVLPTTSDIAATLGYKLNDKTTAGIGLSYKLGWGNGWKNIKLTNQGIGLRTYIDVKFPALQGGWGFFTRSLWLSGGYEQNYLPDLKERLNATTQNYTHGSWGKGWQESCLFGIAKKQKMGKRIVSMQLLYDVLSTKNFPQTSAWVFRVGWGK